jgi:hypothetical protein
LKVPLDAAGDPHNATHIRVRVIEYTVFSAQPGGKAETFRLIATIADVAEVVALGDSDDHGQ